MKGRQISYSADELAWIKANCTLPRRDLHRAFLDRFGRSDVTFDHIKALCTRRGWATGRTGCFEKGQEPANKGKKMPFHPRCAATQFKKGCRKGRANQVYKPIGTERLSKEGYLQRKVNDDLPFQRRWRGVHIINWEAVNGPMPDGHALKCLDGNRLNTDARNWELIPRAMLPRLTGRWSGVPYDSAPTELKPTILATAKLEQAVREARGNG